MSYTVKYQDDKGNSSSLGPLTKVLEARSAAWILINRLNDEGEDFREVPTSLSTFHVYEWRSATGSKIWVEED